MIMGHGSHTPVARHHQAASAPPHPPHPPSHSHSRSNSHITGMHQNTMMAGAARDLPAPSPSTRVGRGTVDNYHHPGPESGPFCAATVNLDESASTRSSGGALAPMELGREGSQHYPSRQDLEGFQTVHHSPCFTILCLGLLSNPSTTWRLLQVLVEVILYPLSAAEPLTISTMARVVDTHLPEIRLVSVAVVPPIPSCPSGHAPQLKSPSSSTAYIILNRLPSRSSPSDHQCLPRSYLRSQHWDVDRAA